MKKATSIILCLVIILSFSSSAFAANKSATLSTKYAQSTEFSSIMKSANDEYAMITDSTNTLIPVGRLDIALDDKGAVDEVLAMANVSNEVKEYIQNLSEKVHNEPENAGQIATLFSPDLLPLTRATVYYTYNGMQMKSDQVYVYNISTGYQFKVTGATALAVAKIVYDIGMFAGGAFSNAVALGGTLLSIFETAAGASVYNASASDFTQIELKYDGVSQWTYGLYNGSWYTGYCSQKITINQVTEYQQFVVNGVGTQKYTYKYPNTITKSPDFDSPWSTAYYYLFNPVTEWISYKVNGTTWMFS